MRSDDSSRWRACCFVKFAAPELSLVMASDWMTAAQARDQLWDMRSCCRSRNWVFWIEPEEMTADEVTVYRPHEFLDEAGAVARILPKSAATAPGQACG